MESTKSKWNKWTRVLVVVCLVLVSIYTYIGYNHSVFYRMELFLILLIILTSGVISVIFIWLNPAFRKYGYPAFFAFISVILLVLISQNLIHNYKPNLNIYIPKNYEGMVYLFPSKSTNSEITINENGIGYIPQAGQFRYQVYHGSQDITDALNEAGRGQIVYQEVNPSREKSVSFSCFEVGLNRTYPTTPWNQKHAQCMNMEQFDSLSNLQIIDTARVNFDFFNVEY